MKMMQHIDGGLRNPNNAPHVVAAVQAILHSTPMVEFLLEDTEHRNSCKSLLKCMCCALFRVYDDMRKCGTGNPSNFVLKWNGLSNLMSLQDKSSPLKVLQIFIDQLRFEQVQRNPDLKLTSRVLHSSPVSEVWKSVIAYQVVCSCGQYELNQQIAPISLESKVYNLSVAIENELARSKNEPCIQCIQNVAEWTYLRTTRLAKSLIVHLNEGSADFTPPLQIKVHWENFELRSLIPEPTGNKDYPVFVAVCPDGHCRRFDDTKVAQLSLANLFMSEFMKVPRLTLIYEKEKEANAWLKEVRKTYDHHKNKDLNSSTTSITTEMSSQLEGMNLVESPSKLQTDDSNNEKAIQATVSTLSKAIQTLPYFTYETCRHFKKFKFFTGLSAEDFEVLYNFIGGFPVISKLQFKYSTQQRTRLRPSKLSCRDKLFMFLLRLRRGLPLEEISVIFNCSVSWAGEICYAMTRLIYLSFKEIELEMFPTAEEQKINKPKKMRPFENLRIILDGVSFYIQTPSNFEQQGNTYSLYKKHNVIVFSVGISCIGATIFCTEGMEGNMSDKQVILKSNLLSRLSPGDGVMTDRGYELTAELEAAGCTFYKPPSKTGDNDFTAEEEILTRAIAAARIYTEHTMADIKDNRLLQGVIPLTMLPVLSDLVYIAAYLRNFNKTRILNKTFRPSQQKEFGDPDDPDCNVDRVDEDNPDDPPRIVD